MPRTILAKSHDDTIMTVTGPINPIQLGKALCHEHLLTDFIGAEEIGDHRWDRSAVEQVILPHLKDLREAGYDALFDCTPAYLGRDPRLLRSLSEKAHITLITNTGFYGARENKFLPSFAHNATADQLAEIWVNEWINGIENTGVKPGFIKIGVDSGPLSDIHETLVRAAARTHLLTGLTIASHTTTAIGAYHEFDVLEDEGVNLNAFIWVHAQAEEDRTKHVDAAKRGVWVSLDGVSEDNLDQYAEMLLNLKKQQLLHQVLISHDAGWYTPGEENGGNFKPFTLIEKKMVPILKEHRLTSTEIRQLLVVNPAKAYPVKIRQK